MDLGKRLRESLTYEAPFCTSLKKATECCLVAHIREFTKSRAQQQRNVAFISKL